MNIQQEANFGQLLHENWQIRKPNQRVEINESDKNF